MKHKVGDKVRVKTWFQIAHETRNYICSDYIKLTDHSNFTRNMEDIVKKHSKREVTITSCYSNGGRYEVANGIGYVWTDEMFEDTAVCEFKRGDLIEVNDWGVWVKQIFVTYIEGVIQPYVCVKGGYTALFKNNEPFDVVNWALARKIEETKSTVTINGKEYSEDTIQMALEQYVTGKKKGN